MRNAQECTAHLDTTDIVSILCSMFDMRLRLKELMAQQGITTAYALHKAAKGNLSMTNCHRLVGGEKLVGLEFSTMAVLCDLFQVTPGELLEHKPKPLKPKAA